MAKIIIKDGEISSSAGINVPGSLTISGNVILGDNFTDTLTVNSIATFNDDIILKDILSGTTANFSTINVATLSASNFVGLPASAGGLTPPGGTDTTIQFNKQGAFSGSANLTYNYTNNILSGTTAQFTILSASNTSINGNLTITGSNNGIILPDGSKLTTAANFVVNLLIVGGGGGGGSTNTATTNAGGGGGGGYFESGVTTFGELFLSTGKAYRLGIGAGGSGGNIGGTGNNGNPSQFGLNTVLGGGGGGGSANTSGRDGGSGGGSANGVTIGKSVSVSYIVGNNGSAGDNGLSGDPGGGGGGSESTGGTAGVNFGASGGLGVASTITGTSIRRGGGGGGGHDTGSSSGGNGGNGGGGAAGSNANANSGGGGGGAGYSGASTSGGNGGSGVIIIKYPSNYTATFTAGVVQTTTIDGSSKITIITGASPVTDTVTFS